jgi:calcineurin-like phosphoesterase family protein
MPRTFFTSDTHFGHANIIEYCKRPFKTFGLMDAAIVNNWNTVVQHGDTVYHLGDFAFGRDATQPYINGLAKRLNGNVHLIHGNHEKIGKQMKWFFKSMKDYDEIEIEGQRIVLFHYGLRTWHHDLRGTWHIYGHSHGGLPPLGKSMDVGVDSWSFTPVSFEQLKAAMDKRPVGKHPEFQNYKPRFAPESCGL